jgi:DNA-binding transcriptional ArsR family regulator
MVTWDVGDLPVPSAEIRVEREGDSDGMRLPFPETTIHVASVLPAGADVDTLALKPARGVVGPNWSLTEKAAAALALLAALIAAIVVYRRRGASSPPRRPGPGPARTRAIRELEALARSGFLEAGEYKAFYSELSSILRRFLAEQDPLWGVELTTAEIVGMVARDGLSERSLEILAQLLVEADLVKFARRRPREPRARSALEESRGWIERFGRRLPKPVEGVADAGGTAAGGEIGDDPVEGEPDPDGPASTAGEVGQC